MLIWIAATLAVAVFVAILISSRSRRHGLLDLGYVSTQWLSEHREYQDGDRSR
jgi:hypothetical protein